MPEDSTVQNFADELSAKLAETFGVDRSNVQTHVIQQTEIPILNSDEMAMISTALMWAATKLVTEGHVTRLTDGAIFYAALGVKVRQIAASGGIVCVTPF